MSIVMIMAMLMNIQQLQARVIVDKSDRIKPHWCEQTNDIGRYRHPINNKYTYDYICSIEPGVDINFIRNNRIRFLSQSLEQTNKIDGVIDSEYFQTNRSGTIEDTETYKIIFHTKTAIQEFECVIIDEYWEKYSDGEYRLYTLFAVSIPGIEPHFDSYQKTPHYEPAKGLVRSLIPGWGQIYKGSKIKGGLIIAGEAIGVGGIITCYSMKSSYEKLMQEDPKHLKEYSMSADMWQNIGYGCIAFTAAVYIYNLIDAALAPGARQIRVYPRDHAFKVSPNVTMDGSVGFAMKYNF